MGEPTTFIKLDRSFLDHWLNLQRPYDEAHAWIYLLIKANYKEGKHRYRGTLQVVRRGELMTSETKLAEEWGWSRKRVHNFLNTLENDAMIEIKRTADGTAIFVENYEKYQGQGTAKAPPTTQRKHRPSTAEAPPTTHTIKNSKEREEREERKEGVFSDPSGEEEEQQHTPPEILAELAKCIGRPDKL